MKVRQDAWSHEDDLLLAETVLRYIREGGTQLGAFDEVGDKLNRTSAACGFRWNAEVRKNYEQAIAIAKKQRKERKRAIDRLNKENESFQPAPEIQTPIVASNNTVMLEEYSTELLPAAKSITLDDCISFLSNLKQNDYYSSRLKNENESLKRENDELQRKNRELEKRIEKLSEQQTMIQEDYQALVQIMDRARRMVMLEDSGDRTPPTFRMDKNGNLEQIAK